VNAKHPAERLNVAARVLLAKPDHLIACHVSSLQSPQHIATARQH
jgi:hypothetical protein